MPIYEYFCSSCSHEFEAIIKMGSSEAACPQCGSLKVEKLMSSFLTKSKGGRPVVDLVEGKMPQSRASAGASAGHQHGSGCKGKGHHHTHESSTCSKGYVDGLLRKYDKQPK